MKNKMQTIVKSNKFLWILFIIVTVPLACSIYFLREQEREFDKLDNSIQNIRAGFEELKRKRDEVDKELNDMQALEEQTESDMQGFQ